LAISNDAQIIIARGPGVFQKLPAPIFKGQRQRVAQPVESIAQRGAPRLIPAGMAAGVAPAVAPPTVDAVKAAPRSFLDDFHLVRGRMPFQVFSVIRESRQLV